MDKTKAKEIILEQKKEAENFFKDKTIEREVEKERQNL